MRLELFFSLPTDHLSTLIKAIQGLLIAMRITFKASLLIAAYKAPDGLATGHCPPPLSSLLWPPRPSFYSLNLLTYMPLSF